MAIRLSKEASDELVRLLYLLIDEIQFSQYDNANKSMCSGSDGGEETNTRITREDNFDDPVSF